MALKSAGDRDRELLEAQAHIWNHIFSFVNSLSLKCAVQLGIADIIYKHGRPMSLPKLIDALPINKAKSSSVNRLMRLLVHSGFFVKQKITGASEEEGYWLAPASRLLLKDEPLNVLPLLLGFIDPIMIAPFHHFSEWFKNDDPTPFDTAHGRTFFDYLDHEPKIHNFFNEAMASDSRLVADIVLRDCRVVFEGFNSLVDVGGGTGTMTRAIASAFPDMKCINFDLPHVVDGLQSAQNLTNVRGDFFESVPPADVALLKWILHDWNDEECVKILRNCKEAIASKGNGGKVIIIDMMVENKKGDDESVETQLFFDMLMMVYLTGKERNEKEWAKLFSDAGFSGYKLTPILNLRTIIEVYP